MKLEATTRTLQRKSLQQIECCCADLNSSDGVWKVLGLVESLTAEKKLGYLVEAGIWKDSMEDGKGCGDGSRHDASGDRESSSL